MNMSNLLHEKGRYQKLNLGQLRHMTILKMLLLRMTATTAFYVSHFSFVSFCPQSLYLNETQYLNPILILCYKTEHKQEQNADYIQVK